MLEHAGVRDAAERPKVEFDSLECRACVDEILVGNKHTKLTKFDVACLVFLMTDLLEIWKMACINRYHPQICVDIQQPNLFDRSQTVEVLREVSLFL